MFQEQMVQVFEDGVAVVVLLALGASIGWLIFMGLQRPSKDISQDEPQSDPNERKTADNDPNISADFRILIDAIRNQGAATRQEYRREDRRKSRREWITIGLIAATLGAVILQVREMIRVYGPVKEQADAANKSADAAAGAERAWVGPLTATVNAVQKDKGIVAVIPYQNTGREPAANFYPVTFGKVYSLNEWNDGTATKDIMSFSSDCLKIKDLPSGLQVVYPSVGGFGAAAYQLTFDTEKANPKIIVTDDIIAGTSVFTTRGCFTYKSIKEFHHSAFCFYYLASFSTLPNLSICNVGNDAD